jgi:uncharacterized protein
VTSDRGGPKSRCPICGAAVEKPPPDPPATPPQKKSFFPFCSDRCRMVDLGRWLTGQYVIPGETVTEEEIPPAARENEPD